ncbi:PACE efflux transporter [Alkanindiges illinoisensis]|uniref:PACE efflux transporter n=1 Tax=Alkanindiges illinoisensis TaxID=197183 RepID=UPI000685FC10|nr:PACE efflux transporter [Alkanindiges illinoisensis]
MQGLKRRVIQAISYEAILLSLFIPIVTLVFKQAVMDSAALGMSLTILALLWNIIFNYGFEKWEVQQGWYTRGLKQRLLHALGFEGGLLLLGVPVIAYFLGISLLKAIIADIGFTIVIMIYTFIFQWAFDRLFGEPERTFRRPKSPHQPI